MAEETTRDVDEDGKIGEDEYSSEDIEREASSRLMIEKGNPLPIKRIIVNYWRSGLHGAKVGIKKDAQWQSKSRQFAAEMDIVGDILYEFDEDRMLNDKVLKYYEIDRAKELGQPLSDLKRDPKTYEKQVLKPLKKLPKAKKQEYLDKNNEKLGFIPPENNRKLVIAVNKRYWDTKVEDRSSMEEVDVDQDGKVDKKRYLENYLTRKFDEFAGINKRLIVKVFRDMAHSEIDKRGTWLGSIEQSLLESMTLTFGEKDPLYTGVITLPGFDYQIQIARAHAVTGHRFVLPVISRKVNMEDLFEASVMKGVDIEVKSQDKLPINYYVKFFLVEGKRFTPGSDYVVKDPMNGYKIVAEIDGKAVDIGGRWDITIDDDALAKDPLFRSNLVLFTCMVKYHPEMQKAMRGLYNEMKRKIKEDISDDQLKAQLAMYIEKLEKRKGITIPDKPNRIDFAMKLLKTEKYDNVDMALLLGTKYFMNITPHELSMLFNPRRVRS
nr:hypothetical protein [Candidatus Sigynarchaeota archaeon]